MEDKRKAATEEDIAELHSLITQLHNKKAKAILQVIAKVEEVGEEGNEVVATIVDSRQLATMQKWVEYNGVRCSVADGNAETELAKRLKEIRDKQACKVIDAFGDEDCVSLQ